MIRYILLNKMFKNNRFKNERLNSLYSCWIIKDLIDKEH